MKPSLNLCFGPYYKVNTSAITPDKRTVLTQIAKLSQNGNEILEHFGKKGFSDKITFHVLSEKEPIVKELLKTNKIQAESGIFDIWQPESSILDILG